MSLFEPSLGIPLLALVTTLHVAAASLRNHRAGARLLSPLALVSAGFGALPWLLPSVAGVASGLAAHACWFALCERWGRTRVSASAPAEGGGPRPTSVEIAKPAASRSTRPKGFVQVPVLSVIDETADIRTFRLARPEGFLFEAGQFLTVRMRTDGQENVRCYSISSAPEATGYLEISVKRQGLVSGALHATTRPGTLLSVRAPAGRFTYPTEDDRPIVLIAGGVGITPLMSMLRHAALAEPTRPIHLLYSSRTLRDLAFRDELTWLARRSPHIQVTFAVTGGDAGPDVYPGRIDRSLLGTVPNLIHAVAMICGPQQMIDGVSAMLSELGMMQGQIRSELFEAAIASSARHRDPVDDGGRRVAQSASYCLKATKSRREGSISAKQTLLEAAEHHGFDIPSICRSGVCGTCRTRVLEGEVECSSDVLDEDDRRSGYVLACVTSVLSDCVIEA